MVAKAPDSHVDIDAAVRDTDRLMAAFEAARRDALIDHKRTGDPIVVMENGRIVWIPADRIQDDGTIR